MDYEKKYKEALGNAKRLYEQGTITESLAYIFPELAESEDEKIRKVLLESFEYQIKESYPDKEWVCGVKLKEIIAWLEKQREHKPAESKPKFKVGDWITIKE